MYTGAKLDRVLAKLPPRSFTGDLARCVGLAGLLTPLATGGKIEELQFLCAGRRRNRFTLAGGPKSIYFGEDESIGAAEVKRTALLGAFAKKVMDPSVSFWVHANLPNAVLDLTDPAVLTELGATDEELHDPDWRDKSESLSELLGDRVFASGRFAALKFWSVRARLAGKKGYCLCIFKSRVISPLTVSFSYGDLKLAEKWE